MSKTIECLKMLRVSIEIDADKVIQNYCNLKLSEHTFLDTKHDKHQRLNLREFIKLMMLSKQINSPLIEVENHKIYSLFYLLSFGSLNKRWHVMLVNELIYYGKKTTV